MRHRIASSTPPQGIEDLTGLIDHTEAGSQYTGSRPPSFDEGVDSLVGSVGDAYDSALADPRSVLTRPSSSILKAPGMASDEVELATLEWIDWFNTERTHESIDD